MVAWGVQGKQDEAIKSNNLPHAVAIAGAAMGVAVKRVGV